MHILLAEDEDDVREFLKRALYHCLPTATVTVARNGLEALQEFQRSGPDLIISDHRMPLMTGLELLRAVRAVSDVPMVIISADPVTEAAARESGVSEFFHKPVSIKQMRQMLSRFGP